MLAGCGVVTPSAEQDARAINQRQAHIAAVSTETVLLQQEQAAEAKGTQVAADATSSALAAPGRATATAEADAANRDSLATLTTARATATVTAAQIAANAESTRTVQNAINTQKLADAQAQAANAAAAQDQAWLDRCVAAVQITIINDATTIASQTATVDEARAAALKDKSWQFEAIHDASESLRTCRQCGNHPAATPTAKS